MPGTNYVSPSTQISFFITNICSLAKSTLVNRAVSGHASFILFIANMIFSKILATDKKLLQKSHGSSSQASRHPGQSAQTREEAVKLSPPEESLGLLLAAGETG